MILNDEPHLVKSRGGPDCFCGGVASVHELVGTVVIQGAHRGYLLTSAERFSPQAHAAARSRALKEARVEITLMYRDELIRLLRLTQSRLSQIWSRKFEHATANPRFTAQAGFAVREVKRQNVAGLACEKTPCLFSLRLLRRPAGDAS